MHRTTALICITKVPCSNAHQQCCAWHNERQVLKQGKYSHHQKHAVYSWHYRCGRFQGFVLYESVNLYADMVQCAEAKEMQLSLGQHQCFPAYQGAECLSAHCSPAPVTPDSPSGLHSSTHEIKALSTQQEDLTSAPCCPHRTQPQ